MEGQPLDQMRSGQEGHIDLIRSIALIQTWMAPTFLMRKEVCKEIQERRL